MQSLWMLVASFLFSIMGVCVKLASETYSTSEIVMGRGLIGIVVMAAMARMQGGSLLTSLPWHHAWRGAFGVAALWLWFYALAELPLATAVTLNYMAPIWIAVLLFAAAWRRGQTTFEWGLSAAIATSFGGVTLLLQPSLHADQWLAGLTGLASGMLSALAYLQVRRLGQMGEPEYRVVFYFSLTGVVAGLAGTLAGPILPGGEHAVREGHNATGLMLVLAIGITATLAQVAMTRAYRLGNTLLTANLQYTGIVFASVWGILIWGDLLNWMGWLGIAAILASGVAATYYNARNAPRSAKTSVAEANDPIATEA